MNQNEQLIHRFYTCFGNKDYQGMQNCYSDKAVFNDPVFQNLDSSHVKAMWEMFCKKGRDLSIEFSNIHADEVFGTAQWKASYTFSQSGRKVTNTIQAKFKFEDGLIVNHDDNFDFYKWSRQALGLPGIVLGKTTYLKNKVRRSAAYNLESFMKKSVPTKGL